MTSPEPVQKDGNIGQDTSFNNNVDDMQICQRVCAGDHNAFQELINRYGQRLFTMLVHCCNGDQVEAEEHWQEGLSKAFEKLSHYDGSCQFYTWLYRISRNRFIDRLRQKQAQTVDPKLLNEKINKTTLNTDKNEQEELQSVVRTALASLKAEQRELLLLRDFENMSYEDLAILFQCELGTIKSRLARARAALRKNNQLRHYLFPEQTSDA